MPSFLLAASTVFYAFIYIRPLLSKPAGIYPSLPLERPARRSRIKLLKIHRLFNLPTTYSCLYSKGHCIPRKFRHKGAQGTIPLPWEHIDAAELHQVSHDKFKNGGAPMRFRIALYSLFALLVSCSIAMGQTITGSVTGTVSDPSRAAVAAAKVVATNLDTRVDTSTTTTANGVYVLRFLQISHYKISITAQ